MGVKKLILLGMCLVLLSSTVFAHSYRPAYYPDYRYDTGFHYPSYGYNYPAYGYYDYPVYYEYPRYNDYNLPTYNRVGYRDAYYGYYYPAQPKVYYRYYR